MRVLKFLGGFLLSIVLILVIPTSTSATTDVQLDTFKGMFIKSPDNSTISINTRNVTSGMIGQYTVKLKEPMTITTYSMLYRGDYSVSLFNNGVLQNSFISHYGTTLDTTNYSISPLSFNEMRFDVTGNIVGLSFSIKIPISNIVSYTKDDTSSSDIPPVVEPPVEVPVEPPVVINPEVPDIDVGDGSFSEVFDGIVNAIKSFILELIKYLGWIMLAAVGVGIIHFGGKWLWKWLRRWLNKV